MATEDVEHPLLDEFDGWATQRAAEVFSWLTLYHRLEVRGIAGIPRGPALLVGNHSGGFSPVDALFLVPYYEQRGHHDPVYALAHDILFRFPPLRRWLARLAVVPASHGYGEAALARGHKVLVFPGGDLENMRPFSERQRVSFSGRSGFARLALRAGVPIIPVVSAGAHETLVVLSRGRFIADLLHLQTLRVKTVPVALNLPWGLVAGPGAALPFFPLPARITVEIGEAIQPGPFDTGVFESDACRLAAHVESVMQAILSRLYAERKYPVLG